MWRWPVARALAGSWSNTCMGAATPAKALESAGGKLLVRLIKPQPDALVGMCGEKAPGAVSGRAPLINSAFINAGLLVRPRRRKNSCMRARLPETRAAARLVPDS